MGLPPRLCVFCGIDASPNESFTDYAGRVRYYDGCKGTMSRQEINQQLLMGGMPE